MVEIGWNARSIKNNKNVSRDVITLYLNNCESCKKKGSMAKKY